MNPPRMHPGPPPVPTRALSDPERDRNEPEPSRSLGRRPGSPRPTKRPALASGYFLSATASDGRSSCLLSGLPNATVAMSEQHERFFHPLLDRTSNVHDCDGQQPTDRTGGHDLRWFAWSRYWPALVVLQTWTHGGFTRGSFVRPALRPVNSVAIAVKQDGSKRLGSYADDARTYSLSRIRGQHAGS